MKCSECGSERHDAANNNNPNTINLIKEPLQDLTVGSHSEPLQDLTTEDTITTRVLPFVVKTFQDDHAQQFSLLTFIIIVIQIEL